MTSYSPHPSCQIPQLAEIYSRIFGFRTDGTFAEIGAYDGETCSNTSCLADLGWRGLYVEPVQRFAAACKYRHRNNRNVAIVPVAAGARDGQLALSPRDILTSSDPMMMAAFDEIEWAKGIAASQSIKVPQFTLDRILSEFAFKPGFELLVIDVEGAEEAVMAGFDLAHWHPQVMIVELEDFHPDFQRFPDIVKRAGDVRNRIVAGGYVELYRDSINTVFAHDAAGQAGAAANGNSV